MLDLGTKVMPLRWWLMKITNLSDIRYLERLVSHLLFIPYGPIAYRAASIDTMYTDIILSLDKNGWWEPNLCHLDDEWWPITPPIYLIFDIWKDSYRIRFLYPTDLSPIVLRLLMKFTPILVLVWKKNRRWEPKLCHLDDDLWKPPIYLIFDIWKDSYRSRSLYPTDLSIIVLHLLIIFTPTLVLVWTKTDDGNQSYAT